MDVRDRESTVTLGIIPLREVLDHREIFRDFPAAHDAEGESKTISYGGLENALAERDTQTVCASRSQEALISKRHAKKPATPSRRSR